MLHNKKLRPLLALGAAVLVLGAALLLLTLAGGEDVAAPIPLCPLAPEAVDTVAYREGETDVRLQKDGDGNWYLSDDPALPLDQATAQAMVESMCALQADRELDAAAISDDMGLAAPSITLELTAGADRFALTVGTLNTVTDADYAQVAGNDSVYTVGSASLSGLCHTRRTLYARPAVTGLNSSDLTGLTVQNGAGELRFVWQEDAWHLADDPGYALDQTTVARMANTICNLQADWCITAPGADTEYGLDAPNAVVTASTADGQAVVCRFGATIPGADESDKGACYLAADSAPGNVFEVAVEHLQAFAYTKEALAADGAEATPGPAADDPSAQYPVGKEGGQ